MKRLFLIVCLLLLVISKTIAQRYVDASKARAFQGKVIWIDGYVMAIKVVSASKISITIGNFNPDSCITVVLSGKGAYKNAIRLEKRTIAEAKGLIKITDGKPCMTITDFRRLRQPYCNCVLADKNIDVLVDTIAFPNEREMFKKPGANRK